MDKSEYEFFVYNIRDINEGHTSYKFTPVEKLNDNILKFMKMCNNNKLQKNTYESYSRIVEDLQKRYPKFYKLIIRDVLFYTIYNIIDKYKNNDNNKMFYIWLRTLLNKYNEPAVKFHDIFELFKHCVRNKKTVLFDVIFEQIQDVIDNTHHKDIRPITAYERMVIVTSAYELDNKYSSKLFDFVLKNNHIFKDINSVIMKVLSIPNYDIDKIDKLKNVLSKDNFDSFMRHTIDKKLFSKLEIDKCLDKSCRRDISVDLNDKYIIDDFNYRSSYLNYP